MSELPHLAAHVQGLRQQIDEILRARHLRVGKESSFALPGFVTSQDEDAARSLESAWMLGKGEEDQPNAEADRLENYWLRVDRNAEDVSGISGRLDLRMNEADALLWCHAKGASGESEFVTVADFGLGFLKIVSEAGTADSPAKFFQANLSNPANYLLTLQLAADKKCEASVTEETVTLTLDAGNAEAKLKLQGAAQITVDTSDVGGQDCQFHEWTQDGLSLTPPLYVLSSKAADISLLPCVFQWDKETGHLGIGTVTGETCPALAQLDVAVAGALTLHAGGDSTGELTLHGGSGAVSLLVGAEELSGLEISYGGSQHINVLLGTSGSGIEMDFGGGLTVVLDSGDLAALGSGTHEVKFREVDVCVDGESKKMVVLAGAPYDPAE